METAVAGTIILIFLTNVFLTLRFVRRTWSLPHCKVLGLAKFAVVTSLFMMTITNMLIIHDMEAPIVSILHKHVLRLISGISAGVVVVQLLRIFDFVFPHYDQRRRLHGSSGQRRTEARS